MRKPENQPVVCSRPAPVHPSETSEFIQLRISELETKLQVIENIVRDAFIVREYEGTIDGRWHRDKIDDIAEAWMIPYPWGLKTNDMYSISMHIRKNDNRYWENVEAIDFGKTINLCVCSQNPKIEEGYQFRIVAAQRISNLLACAYEKTMLMPVKGSKVLNTAIDVAIIDSGAIPPNGTFDEKVARRKRGRPRKLNSNS